MSTKKTYDIEKLLTEVKYLKKLNNWTDVSEYFGVDNARVSAWKQRNSQAAMEFICKKCQDDVELRGLMLKIDDYIMGINNKHVVNIVDYKKMDVELTPTDGETAQMVAGILSSQSQINRVALIASVKALWKACQGEVEMSDLKEEMAALRTEMREGHQMLMKMMNAMVSGGEKKRDSISG